MLQKSSPPAGGVLRDALMRSSTWRLNVTTCGRRKQAARLPADTVGKSTGSCRAATPGHLQQRLDDARCELAASAVEVDALRLLAARGEPEISAGRRARPGPAVGGGRDAFVEIGETRLARAARRPPGLRIRHSGLALGQRSGGSRGWGTAALTARRRSRRDFPRNR